MPSFSDLPGSEGFLFSDPALVSQALTRGAISRAAIERSVYAKTSAIGPGFGRLATLTHRSRAVRGSSGFLCSGHRVQSGLHQSRCGTRGAFTDNTRRVWGAGGSVRPALPGQPIGFDRRGRIAHGEIRQAGA